MWLLRPLITYVILALLSQDVVVGIPRTKSQYGIKNSKADLLPSVKPLENERGVAMDPLRHEPVSLNDQESIHNAPREYNQYENVGMHTEVEVNSMSFTNTLTNSRYRFVDEETGVKLMAAQVAAASSSCIDPLTCALQQVSISIPGIPLCQSLSVLGKFCVQTLVCSHLTLDGVPSSYIRPDKISINVKNLGLACKGSYSWSGSLSSPWTGDINIVVSNPTIQTEVVISPDPNTRLPSSLTFENCIAVVPPESISISFTNTGNWASSAFNQVLNLAASMLAPLITGAINTYFCSKIFGSLVSNAATSALKDKVDPLLVDLINSPPGIVPSYIEAGAVSGRYVNWHKIAYTFELPDIFKNSYFDYALNLDAELNYLARLLEGKLNYLVNLLMMPLVGLATKAALPNSDSLTVSLGNIKIPISLGPLGHFVDVTLTDLVLTGLKTIANVNLQPTSQWESNVTLAANLDLQHVDAVIVAVVTSPLIPGYSETYNAHVFLTAGSSALIKVAVGVDQFKVGNTHMYQFLNSPQCFIKTLSYSAITSIKVKTYALNATLTHIPKSGQANPTSNVETVGGDLLLLTDNVLELFLKDYSSLLTDIISGAIEGPLRDLLNGILGKTLSSFGNTCPPFLYLPEYPPKLVNWPSNWYLGQLNYALNQDVGPNGLNFGFGNDYLKVSVWGWNIGLKMNSVTNFSVLVPVPNNPNKTYDLVNKVQWKNLMITIQAPPNAKFSTVPSLNTFTSPTFSGYSFLPLGSVIHINMTKFFFVLDLMAKENINKLMNLQVKQLGYDGCLMSTFAGFKMNAMKWGFGTAHLSITSGPNNEVKFYKNVDFMMNLVMRGLNSPAVFKFLNGQLFYVLNESAPICANNGSNPQYPTFAPIFPPEDKASPVDIKITMALAGIGAFLTWVGYEAYRYKYGKPRKPICLWGRQRSGAADSEARRLGMPVEPWYVAQWHHLECNKIILLDKRIPLVVRIFEFFLTVATTVLFAFCVQQPDSVSVFIKVQVGNFLFRPPPLYVFGLWTTIVELWNNKLYLLSSLIAVYSGAWLFFKLGVILSSLLLPPGILSPSLREKLLMFIDASGKWMLIDIFVMVLFMAAFFINVAVLPQLQVTINIMPNFGFDSILLSMLLSLVAGHIAVAMDRHVSTCNDNSPSTAPVTPSWRPNSMALNENGDVPFELAIAVTSPIAGIAGNDTDTQETEEANEEEDIAQALIHHTFLVSFHTLYPNIDVSEFEKEVNTAKETEENNDYKVTATAINPINHPDSNESGIELAKLAAATCIKRPHSGGHLLAAPHSHSQPRDLNSLSANDVLFLISNDASLSILTSLASSTSVTGEILSGFESAEEIRSLLGCSMPHARTLLKKVLEWKESGVASELLPEPSGPITRRPFSQDNPIAHETSDMTPTTTSHKLTTIANAPEPTTSIIPTSVFPSSSTSIPSSSMGGGAHNETLTERFGSPQVDYKALLREYVKMGKPLLHVRTTLLGRITFFLFTFVTGLVIIISTCAYTMQFNITGLVGYLMKDNASKQFSFLSIGELIPEASGEPTSTMVKWIAIMYLTFVLAMPLAFCICALVLWFAPLSHTKWAHRMLVTAEVFNAWSALDVFFIALAASFVGLRQFYGIVVSGSCTFVNEILVSILHEELKHEDRCFDVNAQLLGPSSWLALAAIMTNILAFSTLRPAFLAFNKQGALINAPPHPDSEEAAKVAPLPAGNEVRLSYSSTYKKARRISVYQYGQGVKKIEKNKILDHLMAPDLTDQYWHIFPRWMHVNGTCLRLLLWLNMLSVHQPTGARAPIEYKCVKWYLNLIRNGFLALLEGIISCFCRSRRTPADPNAFSKWENQYNNSKISAAITANTTRESHVRDSRIDNINRPSLVVAHSEYNRPMGDGEKTLGEASL